MFTFVKTKGEDRDLEYFLNQFKNAQAAVSAVGPPRLNYCMIYCDILYISPPYPRLHAFPVKYFKVFCRDWLTVFVPEHIC